MSKFDSIGINRYFKADGISYRKVSQLIYVDPTTGIENYWDPMFDSRIEGTDAKVPEAGPPEVDPRTRVVAAEPPPPDNRYIVDPQTRVVSPNPNYINALTALAELWGSALFDCASTDYKYMVEECIKWGKSRKKGKKG